MRVMGGPPRRGRGSRWPGCTPRGCRGWGWSSRRPWRARRSGRPAISATATATSGGLFHDGGDVGVGEGFTSVVGEVAVEFGEGVAVFAAELDGVDGEFAVDGEPLDFAGVDAEDAGEDGGGDPAVGGVQVDDLRWRCVGHVG